MIRKTEAEGWQVDKKIPLALLCGLVLQAFAAIWWGATISSQATSLDRRVTVLEAENKASQTANQAVAQTIVRIDVQLNALNTEFRRFIDRQEARSIAEDKR